MRAKTYRTQIDLSLSQALRLIAGAKQKVIRFSPTKFMNLENNIQNRKLLMQIKRRHRSIQNICFTPRLHKNRFNSTKNKLVNDSKAFYNLSTELCSSNSSLLKLKPNLSIKLLNSHRESNVSFKRAQYNDCQASKEIERTRNNFTLLSPIQVNFRINNEKLDIKSFASSVSALHDEIKAALINRKIPFKPFVLSHQESDLALDYYLTIPSSKLNSFLGKCLNLKPYYLNTQQDININSFQIIKAIGTGGFSKVFLVRFKGDGLFYAMKVINKSFILKQKKKQLILNERNIMAEVNHPLHAKLQWAFQSKQSIVFVLDYYPGGELFGLIKRFRRMKQNMARFYIIEILLALEKLHDAGIAYRDMKPQNILLDRLGHVHLADFGLAKPGLKSDSARAYSFCGSPQYMPPEIVAKRGHTTKVDFYSLGALLYELVSGLPPFYNRDPQKIYNATLKQTLTFSPHISKDLKNLLQGLLHKQQQKRLGFKFGVRQILAHNWFGRIEVNDYLEKKCAAPVQFINLQDLTFNDCQMNDKSQELVASLRQQQASITQFQRYFEAIVYNRSEADFKSKACSDQTVKVKSLKIFNKLYKRAEYISSSSSTNRIRKLNNFL